LLLAANEPSSGTFHLQLNQNYCGREIHMKWNVAHGGFQQAADAINFYVLLTFLTISA
jgi:hypothetical protein